MFASKPAQPIGSHQRRRAPVACGDMASKLVVAILVSFISLSQSMAGSRAAALRRPKFNRPTSAVAGTTLIRNVVSHEEAISAAKVYRSSSEVRRIVQANHMRSSELSSIDVNEAASKLQDCLIEAEGANGKEECELTWQEELSFSRFSRRRLGL